MGQNTTLRAMAFIRLMPGCPECSCLRTAFLSFMGTTTRSANTRYVIDDEQRNTALLKLLKVSCEIRGPWMSEKLEDILYHWVALSFSFNLHFCHRNCSDTISECALKIVLYVDDSNDGVVIWDWLQTDEALPGISLTKFCSLAVL